MKKCQYDYEQKCTCAEDDNCGCDNSNNMRHDITCELENTAFPKPETEHHSEQKTSS